MARAVYRLDDKGNRVYLGHVPDEYELRDGEHFYQTTVVPKKLSDSLIMKIFDRLGKSLCGNLYCQPEDLNIYYDEIKTGCFVYCCNYSVLINIELDQDNGKIEVSKEDEFSNGLQYYTTFKLKDFINDNNQNE